MLYEGRRLYGLLLRGYSKPGILARTTDILAGHGLDITYLYISPMRLDERGSILMFLDFTEADIEPEDLAEELETLEFIEKVEVIKPRFTGFIVDEALFPVMLGLHRAIIVSEPALRGFLVDFRRSLGSGGEAMLYHLGRAVGFERARYVNELAKRIRVSKVEDKIAIGTLIFKSLGYGILEVLEFREHPPYLRIRVHRCIECELGDRANRPFGHYIRGIIAGYASEIFKQNLLAVETRCIAVGDPYCELEVKPREKSQGW